MRKRRWVLAAGAAVAALAVGAGIVAAQAGDEDGRTSFLDRVAQKLGIDTPKLEQAITDARSDEIDERAAAGDMTQEEADALKERLEDLPADGFGFAPGFGHAFRGEFHAKLRDACGLRIKVGDDAGFSIAFKCPDTDTIDVTDALTAYLGIDAAQLADEIDEDDASLGSVAEAHGKSRDDLKAFLSGELKTQLDAAVAGGDLTQDRAGDLLADAAESIDGVLDFPGEGRLFKGDHPLGGFEQAMFFGFGLGEVREKLAGFLSIEEAQLLEDLEADNATLATVAEAHGKSREELKAFISAEAAAKLDEAVADGLPQEAADTFLASVNERLDQIIDGEIPFGGRFRGPGRDFFNGHFEFEGSFEFGGEREDAVPAPQRGESAPASRS